MFHGERLKRLRKDKGLVQQDLGDMLGITKSAICLYESGKRQPSIENIIDIMHIFGVSADYLIGADINIKIIEENKKTMYTMTKEEVSFIEELRSNKFVYDILFKDPRRGADLVKKIIG